MKEKDIEILKDFSAAVRDIKLAILQARAWAARVLNIKDKVLCVSAAGNYQSDPSSSW